MTRNELDIFPTTQISEQEARELAEIPHRVLLEEAWEELTGELNKHSPHGNTEDFFKLRRQHSAKLISYWQYRLNVYKASHAERSLTMGRETLTVSSWGDIDERRLEITLMTADEKSQISLTADLRGEVDEFASPPTIQSEIRTDPDEPPDITYKIIFGSNRFNQGSPFLMATFEREITHWDPEGKHPVTYDTRKIRCTTWDTAEVLRT